MGRSRRARKPLPELFSEREWKVLREEFGLTPRQQQVAKFVCHGLTNGDIAVAIDKAPDTVRMHLRSLYEKLGVQERVGVVVKLVIAARSLTGRDSREQR